MAMTAAITIFLLAVTITPATRRFFSLVCISLSFARQLGTGKPGTCAYLFRRSVVKLRLQRAITGRRVFAFRIYLFSFSKTTLITAVVICCLVTIFAIRALIWDNYPSKPEAFRSLAPVQPQFYDAPKSPPKRLASPGWAACPRIAPAARE